MRKRIIFFGLIVFIFAALFAIKILTKLNHKQQIAQQLTKLPQLPVQVVGTATAREWRINQKPTIILFFNSECGHCQYEATAIQARLHDFSKANLVFVSEQEAGKIEAFSKTYKLANQPYIWWLQIQPEEVYNTFGNIGVPHIWVYNKEGNLVKEFRGETKPEALLEWL